MDRQHPLIAFASRWHACSGDVPPPLVGASITFVEVPRASPRKPPSTALQTSASSTAELQDADPSAFASVLQAPIASFARLYVFGGRLVTTRRMVADLWYLDLETLIWTKVSSTAPATASQLSETQTAPKTTPSPRYFHSANVWDNKLIIFGGMGHQAAGTARSDQLVNDSISSAEGGSSNSGKGSAQNHEDLCVLDDMLAFDLATNVWNFSFAANPSPSYPNTMQPIARYAHLASISSEFLIVLGGQNASNAYIERIDIFHLSSRTWVGSQTLAKQCGSYRSLVASPQLVVSAGSRAPIEDTQAASQLANLSQGASTYASTTRAQSIASETPSYSTHASMDTVAFDADRDRHRSDSTASRPSFLSVSSGTANHFTSSPSPTHPNFASDATSFRSGASESTVSLLKSMPGPGTSISLSGLVGNPAQASSANLSLNSHAGSSVQGTSQVDSEDGNLAVGFGSLSASLANGISRSDGLSQPPVPTYTLPMSITTQPPTSGGDACPLQFTVREPREDPDGAEKASAWSAPPLYLYSNYHFTDVKREIEVVSVDMRQRAKEGATSHSKDTSNNIDVSLRFQEISSAMRGTMLPPGLRFPTGAVVGEHLIVSGTYLANTSQSFSIWSLHLPTLIWTRIDLGSVLSTGSWNRAVVWPGTTGDRGFRTRSSRAENGSGPDHGSGRAPGQGHAQHGSGQSGSSVGPSSHTGASADPSTFGAGSEDILPPTDLEDGSVLIRPPFTGNKLVILGHRGRDLVNDYNHRQVNCDHVIIVDLESWGVYQPPCPPFAASDTGGLSTVTLSDSGQQAAFQRSESADQSVARATELGLAKLRSSSQGGLVPLSFSTPGFAGEPVGATPASTIAKDNRPLRSALSPFETRLRSDSTATTSSANSAKSRGQSSVTSSGVSSSKDDAGSESLTSQDASGTVDHATETGRSGEAPWASSTEASSTSLPFAPFSFGGRGDFEIICSDGLWIGCDRIVLERRWPWFAERMKDFRRRAKRFAASPLGSSHQAAFTPLSNRGGGDAVDGSTVAQVGSAEEMDRTVTQSESVSQQGRARTDPVIRLSSSVDRELGSQTAARSASALAAAAGRSRGFTTSVLPPNGAAASGKPDLRSGKDLGNSASLLPRRSPDPRMTPRHLVLPEPSPIVLAMLEFLYTRSVCTALQRHPIVLASLLVLGTTYDLADLVQWCVHAAHVVISSELSAPASDSRHVSRNVTPTSMSLPSFAKSPSGAFGPEVYAGSALNSNDSIRNDLSIEQRHRYAVLLFEAATLCGSEALQIRALRTVMGLNKYEVGRQTVESQRRRTGAGSPGGGDGSEFIVDGMGRPEHGRNRASTTASTVPNPRSTIAGVGLSTRTDHQYPQNDGRPSLEESAGASFGLMPNAGPHRSAGTGIPATGSSMGPMRPRATTGPTKSDVLAGRTSLSGGSQLRNGLSDLGMAPQTQLSPVTGVGAGTGTISSRVMGSRKRFSLFGRAMGSSSGGGATSTSPNPSPSTSNVDVNSTLGDGGESVGNAYEHGLAFADQLRESSTDSLGRPSGETYGLPLTSPSISGEGSGSYMSRMMGNGAAMQQARQVAVARSDSATGSIGQASNPPSVSETPISPPRTSSQPRAIRGLSTSSRTPRGSSGPPSSNLGPGPTSSTNSNSSGAGGSGEQGDSRKTGPGVPPSGLVARLVREREASGGS
ncbi:unnamed protein product [Tilletia controversa]|nr:hypothetical protein A4X03_0g1290 [Tilletia caries]CAD6924944.1 unnamed protein product [Tilletia controversa]CAD6935269.1 unnamed protein product [Tilletia laevis]CAD6891122.1 unnamed protein product [Tilletia caries]CAD6899838.1 unnamed protein product [Tilletia caries]